MAQVLAATTALFRDRDLFIHDGSQASSFRVSASVQAVLFLILLVLVAWASYATARLITRPHGNFQPHRQRPKPARARSSSARR